MNQHDTPGLAVESVEKRILPGLQLLQLIYQKIQARKQTEEQRKEEEATGELAQQNAMPILDIQDFFYVAFDGDGIGNSVAQAEEMDDEEGLRERGAAIENGQQAAKQWARKYGGKIIEDGGDAGIFRVPSIALDEIESFREQYLQATGATVTVGIGSKISESTKARMLGKLRGKNQTVKFDDTTEKELKIRQDAEPTPDENKKLIAAGLGAPPDAPTAQPEPEEEEEQAEEKPEQKGGFPVIGKDGKQVKEEAREEEPEEEEQIDGKPVMVHEREEGDRGDEDDGYDDFGYSNGKELKKTEEPLFKSKKTLFSMYGAGMTPEQKSHAEWAHTKMPNENWSLWAVRAHRADPSKFTPEVKEKVEHFAGSQHIPEVANLRFEKQHDLDTGLKMMEDAEGEYNKRIGSHANVVKPDPQTKKIMDVGHNMAWFSLGRGSCSAEGKAMGHCGNVPSQKPGDRVLSLRTIHKDSKGNELHEPHATFIANGGYLGEMKGRGNTKPAKKYHKAIADLLLHPKIRGVVGGGYLHHQNFSTNDLDPEQKERVLKAKPNINVYESDKAPSDLPEKFKHEVEPIFDWKKEIQEKAGGEEVQPSLFDQNPKTWRQHAIQNIAEGKAPRMAINAIPNPTDDELHQIITGKDSNVESKTQAAMIGKDTARLHGALARVSPEAITYLNNPNVNAIINAGNSESTESLAGNRDLSEKDIDTMMNHPKFNEFTPTAQGNLLDQEKLSPKYHEKFAMSPHESVRGKLAATEGLDPKFHQQLAGDTKYVQEHLAGRQKLSPELQQKMFSAGHHIDLARNKNLSPEIGEKLAQYVASNGPKIEGVSDTTNELLGNENLSPSALKTLAQSKAWPKDERGGLLKDIYKHENLPKDLFDELVAKHSKNADDFDDFSNVIMNNKHLTQDQFEGLRKKFGRQKQFETMFKNHPMFQAKDKDIHPMASQKMLFNHLNRLKDKDPAKYAETQDKLVNDAVESEDLGAVENLMQSGALDDEHHKKMHDLIADNLDWHKKQDYNKMLKEGLEYRELPTSYHDEFLRRLEDNDESPDDITEHVFNTEKDRDQYYDEARERADEIARENYPFTDYLDDLERESGYGRRRGEHPLDTHISNAQESRHSKSDLSDLNDLVDQRAAKKMKEMGKEPDEYGSYEDHPEWENAIDEAKDSVHEDFRKALDHWENQRKFPENIQKQIEKYRDKLYEDYDQSLYDSDTHSNAFEDALGEIKDKMGSDPDYWPKHLQNTEWVKKNIKKPEEEDIGEAKPIDNADEFGIAKSISDKISRLRSFLRT